MSQRWTLQVRCTNEHTCNVALPTHIMDRMDRQNKTNAVKLNWKNVDPENGTICTKKVFVGYSWAFAKV
jgi:hypothetical protein